MKSRPFLLLGLVCSFASLGAAPPVFRAGSARVDLSPTQPVRLMGYASRGNLPGASTVAQPIHARALALTHGDRTAVLCTIDNCILPGALSDEVRTRIQARTGLPPEALAFTVTHTHSAPCLTGAAPNIFAGDIPPAEQAAIDAYTRFFVDRVEAAILAALAARTPATVAWGQGRATFAANRRTPGGPVDHDLPLLRITGTNGALQAVLVSYACHCTTLSGDLNAVHGDWAGSAALELERTLPGAVALVAIGCGADANPTPRGTAAIADAYGHQIASEAARLLALPLTELTDPPVTRSRTIGLPYRPHFTRAEWEQRAKTSGIVGHHARRWLARLDRGEAPGPTLPYPVQTWAFGDRFAMVFLGGEVVVDYSLRLKREFDARRLWINGYANDVPCYIPSRRILQEGGYEAESSLWYYDRPQQLAPETEDLIVSTVRELLPAGFTAAAGTPELPAPRDPQRALEAFRLPEGLAIELVAGDDLVQSPVAIDFGPDGRLWVAEMRDYPSGVEGAGRVKVLADTDGDGRYDQATVVARGLPFPTGLMQWGDGVLVCAAPDIRWFPGVAGATPPAGATGEALLTGFATHNFQARVNGLRWGLDGWIHGAGGLFGGRITSSRTRVATEASGRDFRWRPDTGEFEAEAGVSQQGRIRDDFGEWFGNDNGTLLWHFVLPARHTRRNPYLPPPPPKVAVNRDDSRVFPSSRTLDRFNDPEGVNQLTSACGPELYRDTALGEEYAGNAFVCEPVHNLVRRAILTPEGPTFAARRATNELRSEFLSSTDNWFRPVEVRTGPDGALWVVDFYRFVVEHPRWIPAERLAALDVRAGADRGRIYRIRRAGTPPPPSWRLDALSPAELAQRLASPNGVLRDLAHRRLVERRAETAVPAVLNPLQRLAREGAPAVRAQALAALRDLGAPDPAALLSALSAPDPRLRRFAVTLAEATAPSSEPPAELLALVEDPDPGVRFALALTLGTYPTPTTARVLARLAAGAGDDAWLRHAVLTSCLGAPDTFWREFLRLAAPEVVDRFRDPFVTSVVGAGALPAVQEVLRSILPAAGEAWTDRNRQAALGLLAALETAPATRARLAADPEGRPHLDRLTAELGAQATTLAGDPSVALPLRLAAVRLVGERARTSATDRESALKLLDAGAPTEVRRALLDALGRLPEPALGARLLAGWARLTPIRRAETLGLLQQRPEWTRTLLGEVRAGTVSPMELSADTRDQLRAHRDPSLAQLAREVFPVVSTQRAEVVARFRSVADLPGDAAHGHEVFARTCATCHQWKGVGQPVGPDFTIFRSKPAADFLTAILDPNAAVEPRFTAYTVTRTDGREQTGIVTDETETAVTLVLPGGGREVLARSEIQRLEAGARSLMPERLEEGLQPTDLADLLAWIKRTPAAFGTSTAEQASAQRKSFAREGGLPVAQLKATADPLPYPSWVGRWPLHYCRQTDGQSRVGWTMKPARQTNGVWRARMAAACGLASATAGEFRLRVNGQEVLTFGVTLSDTLWTSADGVWRLRYRVEEANSEDSNGVWDLEWLGGGGATAAADQWTCEVFGSPTGSQRWFGLYDWSP